MGEIKKDGAQFIGYEYKEIAAGEGASFCLDCCQSFSWIPETSERGKPAPP